MKKIIGISAIMLILLLESCVSNNNFVYGPTITANELETVEIIGSVETIFETTINWGKNNILLERSYNELLKEAKKSYTGEIDIKNIIIEKRYSNKNFLLLIPMIFGNGVGYGFTNIYAKGEVIRYNKN